MLLGNAILLAAVYLLGGVTLIPLVCLLVYLGSRPVQSRSSRADQVDKHVDTITAFEDETLPSWKKSSDEENVAAGYFAVCREYVPGGLNGKPPERMTPAGEVIATESPTLYQNIYRSVFERKTQTPAHDQGAPVKRAANVFFVVLRHGHLMLFDNADQIEVRHVVSLSLYDITICGDNDTVPEGQLWIKRNAIKLSKHSGGTIEGGRPSLYLFCDNCSEKEDFYHALLHSKGSIGAVETNVQPEPLGFDTEHIFKLIRQLHASEDNIQTRWLNALVGRVFLALYKTAWLQQLVKSKIRTKISRVSKPAFVSSISLTDVDLGDSAPVFAKPKLKEMAVDGSLTLEADLRYTGNFKAVIAAVVRIELGQRFRAREVDLVLAGILKKLEGHLLVHVKPPPSNRLWISFETPPKMELQLEPIVSSRQITLGIVLRAIESRIREVINETLVLPNWDDLPFMDTLDEAARGGIWRTKGGQDLNMSSRSSPTSQVNLEHSAQGITGEERAASVPPLPPRSKVYDTKQHVSIPTDTSAIIGSVAISPTTPPAAKRSASLGSPTPLHPGSIANTTPRQNGLEADVERTSHSLKNIRRRPVHTGSKSNVDSDGHMNIGHQIISDPDPVSKAGSELQLPRSLSSTEPASSSELADDNLKGSEDNEQDADALEVRLNLSPNQYSSPQGDDPSAKPSTTVDKRKEDTRTAPDKKAAFNQAFTSATATARRWGLAAVQRPGDTASQSPQATTPNNAPYGRGQPLPPPGEPLPGPQRHTWTASTVDALKRRAGSVSELSKRPTT